METVSQGGHSATYSYDPNSIAKKIFIVADENGQTRYYDSSSKCWKKIGLDLVENALAADAKGLEQFIAAQNGPSLREQILKDAFLSGDPSIGDWLLYQFFDKLNGAGTLDLASAYYHHDIFSQQSLSDEAATLYALWGGVQLGAASTELVDLGALAKGLFRPSSSARFYDADYMVDLSGYAVAPNRGLGRVTRQFDAVNPGSLSDDLAGTFAGGRYNEVILEADTILYRAGKEGTPLGQFFSTEVPQGILQTRIDKAVLPVWPGGGTSPINAAFGIKIPAGTKVFTGNVGTQGGVFVGGTPQIVVPKPWLIDGVEHVSTIPLR